MCQYSPITPEAAADAVVAVKMPRRAIIPLDEPGGIARAIQTASNGQDLVIFFAHGEAMTRAAPRAVHMAGQAGVWWTLVLTLSRRSCEASLSDCPCAYGGLRPDGPWDRPRDPPDSRPAGAALRQLLRVRVYWLARFFEAGINALQCDLDVGWVRDPFPLFRSIPNASVVAQSESTMVNAGIVFVRHVSAAADAVTLWLLAEWSNRLMGLGGDEQTTLHDVLTTMTRGSIYLSEQLVAIGHKSRVMASWAKRNRLMRLARMQNVEKKARAACGAPDLTPSLAWRLSAPADTTAAAYTAAVAEVVADCEEDRKRSNGVAAIERAAETRAEALSRQEAVERCASSREKHAQACKRANAPTQSGPCHVDAPKWDWRPGVSLRLPQPVLPQPPHILLASLPTRIVGPYQRLSQLMRTSRCDDPTHQLPCATPMHLVHLSSYPSKPLRAAVLDLIATQTEARAAKLLATEPNAQDEAAASWVWLDTTSWDRWPQQALAGTATKAILAVALAIAKRTSGTLVLPQLPDLAVQALSENVAGHSRRLPHFTDSMVFGCGPSQRFIWLPWGLDDCFGNSLSSLISSRGRVVADVDVLRPSHPAAQVQSSGRIVVHLEVYPNGSVKWARGAPRRRARRNASNSWHVKVGPAIVDPWSAEPTTVFEQASWMCKVARAVEGLAKGWRVFQRPQKSGIVQAPDANASRRSVPGSGVVKPVVRFSELAQGQPRAAARRT